MKKYWIALSLIFLVSACNTSPKQANPTQKILRINFGTDPPSLDPRKLTDTISGYMATMCFDGLTRINKEGEVTLSLAESYLLSEEGLCYTFKLRDAYWSDGTPLTAYDFEDSWKSSLDPAFPCHHAYIFYCIKNARLAKEGSIPLEEVGVRALDEHTLQVELLYPVPYFLEILSSPYFYPYTEAIAQNNLAFLSDPSIPSTSLGPFYIESYQQQNKLSLKKNPHYWDRDAVQLDGIDIFFVSDQNTELSMYEQGEIDWVGGPASNLPIEAMSSLKTRADFNNYPIAGLYYYVFNTKEFPFNNANIRKALTLCINRQALIEHVTQTNMKPATRLIPPLSKPLEHPSFLDADLVQARELFNLGCEELGLDPSSFPTLTISYNGGLSMHYKVVQAIQQQWKEALGVKTRLETLEWKVYLDTIVRKNFHVARLGAVSLCSDPGFFLEMFAYEDGFNNHTGWHSKKFEELFVKTQHTLETEARLALIQQAEELFLEEMPIAPLFFYTVSYLKKDYVKDVALGNVHWDFKWANIDP